ncbi:hypothetical protein V3C99_010243, partial [Haemonchus contortus]
SWLVMGSKASSQSDPSKSSERKNEKSGVTAPPKPATQPEKPIKFRLSKETEQEVRAAVEGGGSGTSSKNSSMMVDVRETPGNVNVAGDQGVRDSAIVQAFTAAEREKESQQ